MDMYQYLDIYVKTSNYNHPLSHKHINMLQLWVEKYEMV